MKTQQQMNAEWTRTVQSNVGQVTLLVPPPVETQLRSPYQYERSLTECRSLRLDLKNTAAEFKPRLQCALVETKAVTYGMRFSIFALGYRPGFCDGQEGLTIDQWYDFSNRIISRLRLSLGEDVSVYVEPWSGSKKFQLRFETYIKYS